MFIYIWAFFKKASLEWILDVSEVVLSQNGSKILDLESNENSDLIG